jgi:CheY-like chemotaxis protein
MHTQTILVADRQTHVLKAITAKLQANGFLVAATSDGIEAYALSRKIQPDLVVVDYQMPRLSGPELCVSLVRDPLTSHVPVVLMVAGGFDASAIPADNITRVIGKPFSPQLLLNIVQDLLADEFTSIDAPEYAVSCAS